MCYGPGRARREPPLAAGWLFHQTAPKMFRFLWKEERGRALHSRAGHEVAQGARAVDPRLPSWGAPPIRVALCPAVCGRS